VSVVQYFINYFTYCHCMCASIGLLLHIEMSNIDWYVLGHNHALCKELLNKMLFVGRLLRLKEPDPHMVMGTFKRDMSLALLTQWTHPVLASTIVNDIMHSSSCPVPVVDKWGMTSRVTTELLYINGGNPLQLSGTSDNRKPDENSRI